jgi:hypothetical protein
MPSNRATKLRRSFHFPRLISDEIVSTTDPVLSFFLGGPLLCPAHEWPRRRLIGTKPKSICLAVDLSHSGRRRAVDVLDWVRMFAYILYSLHGTSERGHAEGLNWAFQRGSHHNPQALRVGVFCCFSDLQSQHSSQHS